MLSIRLFPKGQRHQRSYRLVVAERRSKLNGKFIDDLGHWNPLQKDLSVDLEKLKDWVKKGAQPSLTIQKLLKLKSLKTKK
jgi:small subunit ribosomal protein S16